MAFITPKKYSLFLPRHIENIQIGDIVYPSAENAFQAMKCVDDIDRLRFVGISPEEAARLGRVIPIRQNWNVLRIPFMIRIVYEKIRNNRLHFLLTQANVMKNLFCNNHGDLFWGTNTKGEGKNNLYHAYVSAIRLYENLSFRHIDAFSNIKYIPNLYDRFGRCSFIFHPADLDNIDIQIIEAAFYKLYPKSLNFVLLYTTTPTPEYVASLVQDLMPKEISKNLLVPRKNIYGKEGYGEEEQRKSLAYMDMGIRLGSDSNCFVYFLR